MANSIHLYFHRILFLFVIFFMQSDVSFGQKAQTKIELILSHEQVTAGQSFTALIKMTMPGHWHTYWKNPGEAGLATSIDWELPDFIEAGEIQWPVPRKYGENEFITYGYSGVIYLVVPLSINDFAPSKNVELNATIKWLECEELCVPGNQKVSQNLVIGAISKPSAGIQASIEKAQKRLIPNQPIYNGKFQWTVSNGDEPDRRSFIAEIPNQMGFIDLTPDFFPHRINGFELTVNHATRVATDDSMVFTGSLFKYEGQWPSSFSGIVAFKDEKKLEEMASVQVSLSIGSVEKTLEQGQVIKDKLSSAEPKDPFKILDSGFNTVSPDSFLGNSGIGIGLGNSDQNQNTNATSIDFVNNEIDEVKLVGAPASPVSEGGSSNVASTPVNAEAGDTQSRNLTAQDSESKSDGPTLKLIVSSFGFAILGGVALNFMPCVLPVVFLKLMSFVKMRDENPQEIKKHGIMYLVGVLCCYLFMALVLVLLRATGREMGFGFQFTSPYFVVAMSLLTALIALNLFGVFEIVVSGGAMSAAGKYAGRPGLAGSFWSGCFTTLLGTPCMAPGLAAAAGFALSSNTPPWLMILTFLMMGFGLAAPYLLASLFPVLIKLLPKPGMWMHHFKVAMGFPMAAASVWILTLNQIHYGTDGILWVGLFIICVAFSSWILGTFIQKNTKRRSLAWLFVIFFTVGGYFFALEDRLNWRNPISESREATTSIKPQLSSKNGIVWGKWSPEAIEAARKSGFPVLVDFTATWCVNCKENKKRAIDVKETKEKLLQKNVVTLKADYTLQPPNITSELAKFQRGGVPLNLLYPADPTKNPIVLPTFLKKEDLIQALDSL